MNMVKTYQEFVNESVSISNISYEEAKRDIEIVRDAITKAEKVAVAEKYGINSIKAGEIVDKIKLLMNDTHKSKSAREYTNEDFEWWWNCFDAPTSPVSLKKALDGEKIEWYEFVYNKANELVFSSKRGDYWTRAKKSFDKYLTSALNKDKNSKDVGLQNLLTTLFDRTKEFHDNYIESVHRWADSYFEMYNQFKDFDMYDFMSLFGTMNREVVANVYDKESTHLRSMMTMHRTFDETTCKYFSPVSEDYIAKTKTVKCFSNIVTAKPIKRKVDSYIENNETFNDRTQYADVPSASAIRYYKNTGTMKIKFKWNKNLFIDTTVDDAEKKFKADIAAIAEKVRRINMEEENLELLSIESDAKHYDITLTDGKKKCHARSIFAAEFSEKVTPHYRFIIT